MKLWHFADRAGNGNARSRRTAVAARVGAAAADRKKAATVSVRPASHPTPIHPPVRGRSPASASSVQVRPRHQANDLALKPRPARSGRASCATSPAGPTHLYRRARNGRIRTEHATVADFGPQDHTAASAIIEELASIGRHGLDLRRAAVGASYARLQDRLAIRHRSIQGKAIRHRQPNQREASHEAPRECRHHRGRSFLL